jgi:TRAP-type C4-dicarboxylate transport system substrate-binding protein
MKKYFPQRILMTLTDSRRLTSKKAYEELSEEDRRIVIAAFDAAVQPAALDERLKARDGVAEKDV